jgi:hypothetical protein
MKKLNSMETTLINAIASMCEWHKTAKGDYVHICECKISDLVQMLPSGSGIDCGCKLAVEKSGKTKVIIEFSYHFMNENGFYDGWQDYKLICKPEFGGIGMKIIGKNRNQIKDYFYDIFSYSLNEIVNY